MNTAATRAAAASISIIATTQPMAPSRAVLQWNNPKRGRKDGLALNDSTKAARLTMP